MFDDAQLSLREHLPGGSYLLFILVAGLMAGLVVWSLISAPRNRAAAEDRDLRGQLQTELRSLVGAQSLAPAASSGNTPAGLPLAETQSSTNWKWIAFILLIATVITLWATVNYYVASTTDQDEDGAIAASEAPRPPLVTVPEWMKIAVRSSRDGILCLDAWGRILSANPAAEKFLGCDTGRLPGQKAFEFVPDLGNGPDDLRRFSQVAAPTDVTVNRKDGNAEPMRLALHRVSEKIDPQYVAMFHVPEAAVAAAPVVVVEKATEPVEAAAAPVPASAAEAAPRVGPTAVVNEDALHDLENQVVMLGGFSELVVSSLEPEHPARPDAEAVSRSAARAGLLCYEVAPFAQVNPRNVDLNEFAVAVAAPLARVIDEGCEVKGFRGQGAADVWADPDLLERALCSLAWRTQELAGGLKRVSISVSSGRLDLRMVPKGGTDAATPAAFDALQAIDWIEKQSGTIEMEEHSEAGVRFRIWLPAAAQARAPRSQQESSAASHAAD